MAAMGRPGLSPAQKRDLWNRWKAGQTITEIGLALCKAPGSIHGVLSDLGGIAPSRRHRSDRALTRCEREEISRGVALGSSSRRIAQQLGRSPSTITCELERNGGRNQCRAAIADERSLLEGRRPKQSGWPPMHLWLQSSQRSWPSSGRRSRSPGGSRRRSGTIRR